MHMKEGPLALGSFSQEFVATLVVLPSSQADPVYFFLTKPVREPVCWHWIKLSFS